MKERLYQVHLPNGKVRTEMAAGVCRAAGQAFAPRKHGLRIKVVSVETGNAYWCQGEAYAGDAWPWDAGFTRC